MYFTTTKSNFHSSFGAKRPFFILHFGKADILHLSFVGFPIHGDGATCLFVSSFYTDTCGGVAGGDGDGSRSDRHVVVRTETHAF